MEKILENVFQISTRDDYEKLMSHVEKLIAEATETGALDDPEADNEYIREIGRLSCLGADYENEYIQFEHIKVKKKLPMISQIENEMYSRNLKEKELAKINVDDKLILDYA